MSMNLIAMLVSLAMMLTGPVPSSPPHIRSCTRLNNYPLYMV